MVISAVAEVRTRFIDSTSPTPAEPAPPVVEASTDASISAPVRSASGSVAPASTRTTPPVASEALWMPARVATGRSVPIVVPKSASAPCAKMFEASQPSELKARVTPTAVPVEVAVIAFVARISVSVSARTSSPPAA